MKKQCCPNALCLVASNRSLFFLLDFAIPGLVSSNSRHMLQSWWCCLASVGPGLGIPSHFLVLLGLTPGAGASRFGAALAELLSPLACSLPIYLAVYYLCRLHMPSSSLCPSPTTNSYVRLFSYPPALRNLGSRRCKRCGSIICCLWYLCVHKNIMRRVETINKKS
jgi:hypothetical protein